MLTYKLSSTPRCVGLRFNDYTDDSKFPLTHILRIPFSVIITDMFYREALTPRTEMLTHTSHPEVLP